MDQLLFPPPLIIFVFYPMWQWNGSVVVPPIDHICCWVSKKDKKTNRLLSVFEWWLSLWGQKISINLFSLIDDELYSFFLHFPFNPFNLVRFFLFYSEMEWIILDHFLSWGGRGQKISFNLFSLVDDFILSLSIQPCSIFSLLLRDGMNNSRPFLVLGGVKNLD